MPAKMLPSFTWVSEQIFDFSRTIVPRIDLHKGAPIQVEAGKSDLEELSNSVAFTRSDHIVDRLILLEHPPHRLHIFWSIPPIAASFQISKIEFVLKSHL